MRKKTVDRQLKELRTDVNKILEILSNGDKMISPHSPNNGLDTTMTIKEAAIFLQMESTVIIEKCQKREIPCLKKGRLIEFKKMELIAWMKERKGEEEGSIEDYVNRYLDKHPLRG